MTSTMTLIPYLLVGAYGLKLAWTGDSYEKDRRGRTGDFIRAVIATLYAAGMIYAGGMKFFLLYALIYAPGTILFLRARREQKAAVFTLTEFLVFGGVVACALIGLYALVSGAILI
jgi:arginine:ornithine antiporter/lysine permease